jgi:hypothetical protein
VRRLHALVLLPVLLTACQGAASLPGSQAVSNSPAARARAGLPAVANWSRSARGAAVFSTPRAMQPDGAHPVNWIFAADAEFGNVDVYDATTLALISECPCSGIGLAVDPKTGDLAVSATSGQISVWHVKKKIVQFAALTLSAAPYAIGLVYDAKGDLYAADAGNDVIDFFTKSEIAAGGGSPARSLTTSNLNEAYYLVAPGKSLLADGYDQNGQPIVVSVDPLTGVDTIVQRLTPASQLAEGIATDLEQNLIVNSVGTPNNLLVFKKPWNRKAKTSFTYGAGAQTEYYTALSFDQTQDMLWAGNFMIPNISHGYTNVQANSYPLGTIGSASSQIEGEYYDSIAVDPQPGK